MHFLVFSMLMLLQSSPPLTGKFTDGKLTTEWAGGTGTITLAGQQYPAAAHATSDGFAGTFTSSNTDFPFTANLAGDTLTLTTSGTTYTLHRADAPANPLAGGGTGAAPQTAPGAFAVLSATDAGKSLVAHKPGVTTVQAALEATFPDLARQLGSRPTIGKAYQDAHDRQSGGATFTATADGKPVKGLVSCKLNDAAGATVAVIYSRLDATRADWEKLAAPQTPVAAANQSPASPAQPPPDPKMILGPDAEVYSFPDGTGSVMLAAGYKTQAQSIINPVFITGDHGQMLFINNQVIVSTPDSNAVKTVESNEAMMQRMGGRPLPRSPQMLIAPFTDPVQAIKDLAPQLSRLSESRGGPSTRLDKIVSHQDMPPGFPGAKNAILVVETTRTTHGVETKYRGSQMVQISMPFPGTWSMFTTGVAAPATTFDNDEKVMFAMLHTLSVNAEVLNQRQQQNNQQAMDQLHRQGDAFAAQMKASHEQYMQDQATRFENIQQQHADQMAGYAQHNQQWQAAEVEKQRQSANFIEVIKGTRTVYDTKTGEAGTASLYYVDGVVNSLNEAALDPNRYIQIPLRDEMYPK